jgi:hypothetical protein
MMARMTGALFAHRASSNRDQGRFNPSMYSSLIPDQLKSKE